MYEILKSINETTKLALSDNRIFVLKKIHFEETEIYKKLITVANENVVRVFDTTLIENEFYAIEEYVQGMTLEDYLDKNDYLSDETVKDITLQICNGLEAIHAVGIVHRDINPNNIMVTDDGKIKIIDFGISRIRKTQQCKDTQLLGTTGFASPEQYGFSQTDFQSDIYSLGVLINYLKTRSFPLEKLADGVFSSVILKCTQIDMNNRYKNVAELSADISKKNKLKMNVRKIPGFRKDVWWHKVIAILYYISALFLIVIPGYEDTPNRIKNELLFDATMILLMIFPVPIVLDLGNWLERWSLTKNKPKSSKIIVQSLFITVLVAIALVLISLIEI